MASTADVPVPPVLGSDMMASVRGIVLQLAQRTDAALSGAALESARAFVARNLRQVAEDLAGPGEGFPESVVQVLARTSLPAAMHPAKIPVRLAGTSLVTARFGRAMAAENRRTALVAKALYQYQQDLLDDVLDGGTYAVEEARNLYALCAASLTDPAFDPSAYERQMAAVLSPDHQALVPLFSVIAFELHRRIRAAPCHEAIRPELVLASDRLGLAQAATVLLRQPTLDLEAARTIGAALWSPDPDAPWFERLAAHASWVLVHTLIDLCFLEEPMAPEDLAAHRAIWYDLNVEISYVDHVAGLEKDLRDGICNLAWAAIHEARGETDEEPWAPIQRAEEERVIAKAVGSARRAIWRDAAHFGLEDGYYPFLAILVPVVFTAQGVGNEPWVLDAFLRAFRSSCAASGGESPIAP